jgi:membrane protein YdbS with pleckstrin-like domain
MSYQKDKIALQKEASKYRALNEELKRVNDVNSRIVTRGNYIRELMNLTNSTNANIRSLAPTVIFPVIQLFETQQANDNKLLAGAAPKQSNDEDAQLQSIKTSIIYAVNEISKITNKDEQANKYFELSKNVRNHIATTPEPIKTKVFNIANPILIPIEDKLIASLKDNIASEIKRIETIQDDNAKKQERTQYISQMSNLIMGVHEPLKSKAKAMFDQIIRGEDNEIEAFKQALPAAVAAIEKITNKDERNNKYFELTENVRKAIAGLREPKKTKATNIANPILAPVEDKLVLELKDVVLQQLKRIEDIQDDNTKNQSRSEFINEMSNAISRIHEPLKSKLQTMFETIIKDNNKNQASKLAGSFAKAMQAEYDKFMQAIGLKTDEVNASSKYINDTQSTIKSLVSQATSSIDTLKLKLSEISTNVSQSNASLATLRTYITTVADNVTKSTQSLQEASSAARAAEQYKREAEIYKNQASQFKDLTNQELRIARRINVDISNELVQAKNLMDGTAKALRGANSTAGSENIIQVIRPKEATETSTTGSQGFANINEGFEDYSSYTPEELRRYALVQTYIGRENSARTRMLQASELLAQKESVANNIVMDYMYANEKGTTVSTIMDRISQLNNDKKRKLEINTYYNKAREQYIRILIVIVIACIIIVPLVIANKNNNISHLTFMILTVTIIFFTIIFIFYNFADIYMRDDIDFDKINIPYDRTATILERDGSLIRKKNPLTSLTLTCIGQDCCDGSMVYDYAKNKCIATENFGNMFEQFNAMNNVQSIVYPNEGFINNSNFKNNMMQTSFGCSSIDQFMTNDCRRPVEAVL